MKRGKLKRIISIGLAFTMSLALLSGCGKKSDNADNIVNKVSQSSKDYVFAQEMLDVLGENQYGSRVMYNGDSCFVSTNGDGGKVDIYAFNPDGSDLRRTELKCSDGENYSYLTVDKDMNIYGVYFIYHWSDYEEESEKIDESDDYVRLPSQYELHEYNIMERFAEEQNNAVLMRALRGRKPYRTFKDRAIDLGLDQEYYAFRSRAYADIAREWCRENDIPYTE